MQKRTTFLLKCAQFNRFLLRFPVSVLCADEEVRPWRAETKAFEWKGDELYFPNKDGGLVPVEGLILCRVCLPRNVAPKLRGIRFLPQKIRGKSIAGECALCLEVDFVLIV